MTYIKKLPSIEEVKKQYPLSSELAQARIQRIEQIKNILAGTDKRKLLFIGPCSADNEDAVLEYCCRLSAIEKKVRDKILIVPRVYTSKPRTKGTGYKGMLHRPNPLSDHDDLEKGIIASRLMHLNVILETGLFCVDEMLYPESLSYFSDLLVYVAVGARSVEDQMHRLTASGLELPVGMKNPMDGNLSVLLNSIEAAQQEQSLIYRGWVVNTVGNPFVHAILRGYTNRYGKTHPNYHYEELCSFYDMYMKCSLKNMSVIIDCNHGNSNKNADAQLRIAKDVINSMNEDTSIGSFVKGLMVESYLVDGNQMIGSGVYGKSITDACIGWEKTEQLIEILMEELK